MQAAIRLSLATSAVSTVVIVATGTPLAYLLAQSRFPGRGALQALVDLPIVLPPMVAGIAMLQMLGRQGPLGRALGEVGITVPFTTTAVVLAQVFVAGPFYVSAARVGFASIDPAIREAAYVDGASELHAFRRVVLPVARRTLASGVILAWARALGEFGATIFLAGNREGVTQTMPLAIFVGFEADIGTAIGLSFVLLLTSLVVLPAVRLLGDR